MRNWIFVMTVLAVLLGALCWCAGALSGGPSILDAPPYDPSDLKAVLGPFFALWLALIVMLTAAELDQTRREESR